ncbi:MAG: hypothetical protein HY541_07230 [Deltaproteobacteria bacterium]|nr:hypothetical protein [Deltaproteobacteria bacterium]
MLFIRWSMVGTFLVMLSAVVLAASPLTGSRWRVEITEEGQTVPQFIDQVRFQEDSFTSALFERRGYPTAPFTEKKGEEGSLVWDALQKDAVGAELAWHAEFKGNTMTGKLVWKQADGKLTNYALSGTPVVEEEVEEGKTPAEEGKKGAKTAAKKGGSKWGCSLIPE